MEFNSFYSDILIRMSYTKSINHNIYKSDKKDGDCNDIIKNISDFLIGILIDIQPTNDQEQNTNNNL